MDYQSIDKMNQSLLKKILISPVAFIKQRDKQENSVKAKHFAFGSLVDDMLLSPEIVDKEYYKMKDIDISDALKQITLYIFEYVISSEKVIPWEGEEINFIILKACLAYDYQRKWGDEAKIKSIKEKCKGYYDDLKRSAGKTIISAEDYNNAVICVASLKADEFIGKYLRQNKNCTIYKRFVVQFTVQGIEFKGELDEVYIDHIDKTITPIDFKTTGLSITGFKYEFWKYRYDFQATTYTIGLQQDDRIKKLISEGYKILLFRYIVVETNMINNPMIFRVTNNVIKIGMNGGTRDGKIYEGLSKAIERYKFHTSTNQWNYPMEYYQNKGIMDILV